MCEDAEQTDLKELWAVEWEGVTELEGITACVPIRSGHLSLISR